MQDALMLNPSINLIHIRERKLTMDVAFNNSPLASCYAAWKEIFKAISVFITSKGGNTCVINGMWESSAWIKHLFKVAK